MIDWIRVNILFVIVLVYMIFMILYGHKKGFIRIVFSLGVLILAVVLAKEILPIATNFIKTNTKIEQGIKDSLIKNIGTENVDFEATQSITAQSIAIDKLQLPDEMKKELSAYNNIEIWNDLGVDKFFDFVTTFFSNTILKLIVYIIVFIIIMIILHILIEALDIVAKIPVIKGLNEILGAFAGLAQSLVILWIISIFLMSMSGTWWGSKMITQIDNNIFLSFVFHHNMLISFIKGIIFSV